MKQVQKFNLNKYESASDDEDDEDTKVLKRVQVLNKNLMEELQITEFNISENDESSDSLFVPGENDPFY